MNDCFAICFVQCVLKDLENFKRDKFGLSENVVIVGYGGEHIYLEADEYTFSLDILGMEQTSKYACYVTWALFRTSSGEKEKISSHTSVIKYMELNLI